MSINCDIAEGGSCNVWDLYRVRQSCQICAQRKNCMQVIDMPYLGNYYTMYQHFSRSGQIVAEIFMISISHYVRNIVVIE